VPSKHRSPITSEDLYRFRWIDHIRFNPAGDRVAYQLSWADGEERRNRSLVYVCGINKGTEPVAATDGPRRDHSPEWSPDGRRLAFLSRRGPSDQLFVAELDGASEPRKLTSFPAGVSSPSWSPDGTRLAFLAMVLADAGEVVDDPRPPDSEEELRRPPVARVIRRLDYKHDGSGFNDGRYNHLFVIDVEAGDPVQLTSGPWGVGGFDWAPDGRNLVISANAEPGADLSRDLHLYVVASAGGGLRRLTGGFLFEHPRWSPRGDTIAFLAPTRPEAGMHTRVWVVPVDGGDPRCLTAEMEHSAGDGIITDMRAGHAVRFGWAPGGDRLYFQGSGPGESGVWSCDLNGDIRKEAGGERRIYDFDFNGERLALGACPADKTDLLVLSERGRERVLVDPNPWLEERQVALPERMRFKAEDGLAIDGWLLKPPGFDPRRLHPLILQIHGGPHGQYGWAFFHEFQVLAAAGYVVLCVNPRGSDGYGEDFKRAVVRDWGGKDYEDLMSALDQVIELGFVDTARMGIAGGSYGGFMTNWAIGHTDRFAAAVSMRSISNLVSEYTQHDIVLWGVLEMGPPPWPDLGMLWERSPIRYVKHMNTPLLLTHGENDLRCAISQAEELFGAMRLLGKEVELVRFPGESHDFSRSGRPDRRVERLNRIRGWFDTHLNGKPSAKPPD
jgi:dipeptidyl aminopeptidase/acylaminoacyl peptidase